MPAVFVHIQMEEYMGKSLQVTTARVYCCCLITMMLLVLLMLGGCASLNVVETWSKPAGQVHRYQKVMVLGISKDENRRSMFENIVVDELSRGQVAAVPSHTILPELDKTNREGVIAAVHAAGCDAVLTTRPTSVGNSTVTQQGPNGSVGYVYGASPITTYGGYQKATLQINLYDATTEELVWSSTIKTFDAERDAHVSRELGKFFREQLRKDGFL
jgi:hypothetical protein